MKLCLDCGNTRIKWGLHDGHDWLAQGAVPTAKPQQLQTALAHLPPPDCIVACNVAGDEIEAAVNGALAHLFSCGVIWNRAQPSQLGISNNYDQPGCLGADRWAALLGARATSAGPCLVISAGTATTIDLLGDDDHFLGGLILPGLDLMRSALAGNTAQLPAAAGHYGATPRNTLDAITSGALHATLGAIERMYRILADQSAQPPLCLLTGGAAPLLQPHLTLPHRAEPLLILNGLARLGP